MKNKALKFINPILLILFLLVTVSMIISRLGWDKTGNWWQLHYWSGMLFIFVGIIHLIYNWSWIRLNIFGKKKSHK